MRKLFFISALVGSTLLFSSCSKSSQGDDMVLTPATTIVNATVSTNNTYELVLDKWQNVTITKQAVHSKSSVAETDLKSGSIVYRYTPAMNFIGADEVVLTTKTAYASMSSGENGNCNGNGGNGHEGGNSSTVSYTSTSMTIKINVTE